MYRPVLDFVSILLHFRCRFVHFIFFVFIFVIVSFFSLQTPFRKVFVFGLLIIFHSFINSFHWHVQNATIPYRSQELLPFLCCVLFPATLLQQLFFTPLSPHLAIYFLVHLSILMFPNSYTIPFWEFYFLPFSVLYMSKPTLYI